MKRPLLVGAAVLASLSVQAAAGARDDTPVVVEYVVPPECASTLAFQKLLEAQLARFPDPRRTWRWSVHIHRAGDGYEGTLTSEGQVRTAAASRCDDVTAAMALMIARGDPSTPPPEAPAPCAPPAPIPSPPVHEVARSDVEWRVGARGDINNHGVAWNGTAPVDSTSIAGAMATLSLELPAGFSKMMFEIGAGRLGSMDGGAPLTYTVLDTQSCLVDLSIGTTGLSVLGCLRIAGAAFSAPYSYQGVQYPQTGGALWGGIGGRIRWQMPVGLFVEASLTGMYGTVSGGESTQPAWYDAALGAGFRL